MKAVARPVEIVDERSRAEVLMHPLRIRILEAARVPGSAAELARRLELKPQKVNYHVRRLAEHGFLRTVEERRAGNVVETVYGATAERYVMASGLLGDLSPRASEEDVVAVVRWLSLQAQAEAELAEVFREVGPEGSPVPTLTMDVELRFGDAEERALFARAVRELLMAVVSKYASPARTPEGGPGAGSPYRLVLGCYPIPEG